VNINVCKKQAKQQEKTNVHILRTLFPQSRAVVFITTAAAIYSLGHGLCTFTAVPTSTQPSTIHGTVKRVSAHGLSNNNNLFIYVVLGYHIKKVKFPILVTERWARS